MMVKGSTLQKMLPKISKVLSKRGFIFWLCSDPQVNPDRYYSIWIDWRQMFWGLRPHKNFIIL